MREPNTFDPNRINEYAETAANINALNESIDDQHRRLEAVGREFQGAPEFRELGEAGLAEEQTETVAEIRNRAATIPYAEIGQYSLGLAHEEEAIVKSIEGDPKIAEIQDNTLLLTRLAPKRAMEALALADSLIDEIVSEKKAQAGVVRGQQDDIARKFGNPWTVPQIVRAGRMLSIQAEVVDESSSMEAPAAEPVVEPEAERPVVVTELESVAEIVQIGDEAEAAAEPILVEVTEGLAGAEETAVAEGLVEAPATPEETAEITEVEASVAVTEELDKEQEERDLLKSVQWAVAEYAIDHPGFRMEELRRDVEEIAQLSREEYQFFKDRFTRLRAMIAENLSGKGVRVEWSLTGRQRGQRYELVEIISPEQAREVELTEQQPETEIYDRTKVPHHPTLKEAIRTVSPQELLDMEAEQLVEVPFIQSALAAIDRVAAEDKPGQMRRSHLANEIAKALGLVTSGGEADTAAGSVILANLLEKELLFKNGHHRGTQLFGRDKPAEAPDQQTVAEEAPKLTEAEIRERVEQDMKIATVVLERLNKIRHSSHTVQQKQLLQEFAGSGTTPETVRKTISRLASLDFVAIIADKDKSQKLVRFKSAKEKRLWNRARKQILDGLSESLYAQYEAEQNA